VALFVLVAAGAVRGGDDAARLVAKAEEEARSSDEAWKRFVLERDAMDDAALASLLASYEKAIDLFEDALEIEEAGGATGQLLLLTRRAAKIRFEMHHRQQKLRRAAQPARPAERAAPEARREPSEPAEPAEPGEPEAREEDPARPAEPPDATERGGLAGIPSLDEDEKERKRGIQSLRTHVMNAYFPPRKFSQLVTRCPTCNGRGYVYVGRVDPKTRKAVKEDCGRCNRSGALLDVTGARKAFWLCYSPLYRSRDDRRQEFETSLARWSDDPRRIPEFLKRVRILDLDYHGLWARVVLEEQGIRQNGEGARQTPFKRKTERHFVRLGKRWCLYVPEIDRDLFADE